MSASTPHRAFMTLALWFDGHRTVRGEIEQRGGDSGRQAEWSWVRVRAGRSPDNVGATRGCEEVRGEGAEPAATVRDRIEVARSGDWW